MCPHGLAWGDIAASALPSPSLLSPEAALCLLLCLIKVDGSLVDFSCNPVNDFLNKIEYLFRTL